MADVAAIADRALTLASSFLAESTEEIVSMADGNLDALYEAAETVRTRASGPASEHSAEHLAFSLITSAHTRIRLRGAATVGGHPRAMGRRKSPSQRGRAGNS